MPYFPKSEAHYLTSAGDMVDKICWDYYGLTGIVTELTYARNLFLAEFKAILPAGLLIVLPVVIGDEVLPKAALWNYTQQDLPELFLPSQSSQIADDVTKRKADELAALTTYREQRDYLQQLATVDTGGGGSDGGDGGNGGSGGTCKFPDYDPPELLTADWLTCWYHDADGKWQLAKISPENLGIGGGGGDGGGGLPTGYGPIVADMLIEPTGGGGPVLRTVTILAATA